MDERERAALEEMRSYARQARTWAREAGAGWTQDDKTVAAVAHTPWRRSASSPVA